MVAKCYRIFGLREGKINYIFCRDPYIREMNRQFLKHDYNTDVITFDESKGSSVQGEIYISIDTVKENAGIFGVSFESEMNG